MLVHILSVSMFLLCSDGGQDDSRSSHFVEAEPATIHNGHWTIVMSQNSRGSSPRRGQPKARGGPYKTQAVEQGGSIKGTVVYKGEVPKPRKIQIVKDHEVCDEREKTAPKIRINDQQRVEEVVVFLGDIKAGKPLVAPETKRTVNQKTCTFVPHVQVVIQDEPFDVVNSDPIAHNLNCTQNRWQLFNPIQPKQGMRSEFRIEDPGLASLRCDIHNWMRAYLYVLWHPYFDVTESDGVFELTDVPPGEYELVAWQEHLGETTRKVKVEPGEVTEIELELTKG